MRNRILVSLAAFVAALVLGAALARAQTPAQSAAQTPAPSPEKSKPDFSGAWKMNHTKSQVGPGFHAINRAVFAQKGDSFSEQLEVETPGGAQKVEFTYTTDGKAREGKVMGRSVQLSAAWEGEVLLVAWVDPVSGLRIERRLKLGSDGKATEMLIDEILPDRRNQHKVILERE